MNVVNGKLKLQPYFVSSEHELDEGIEWTKRTVSIKDKDGALLFEQKDVEFPEFWSDTACMIVADKYMKEIDGVKENSLKQLVDRVVNTIAAWAREDGYITLDSEKVFSNDLKYLVEHQFLAFNSPVWFNVGVDENPAVSACFINSVEDDMGSIMRLADIEARIFKHGSGSGVNFSNLRSDGEKLTGGGMASGPVSFMRGYDSFAGVIKSGGKNRRAAKMAILNDSHPDVMEFITSKMMEDQKAKTLVAAGYNPDFNSLHGAYSSVAFQNENHSTRLSDAFMAAVKQDDIWETRSPKTQNVVRRYKARNIFDTLCECAHACGDPGVQYDDTINRFHMTPKSGRINSSNPCAEFLFIDDSSCNLASLNLMRFLYRSSTGVSFDINSFVYAALLMTIAQDVIVDKGKYPTLKIKKNSITHRPLGAGFANLGTALMYCGFPYDSDDGRNFASCISSLLTSTVYFASTMMASIKGPFAAYEANKESIYNVFNLHVNAVTNKVMTNNLMIKGIQEASIESWKCVLSNVEQTGIRNAQATVIAPTGTIGFMMDCDTTGAEPEMSLIKYKTLVGGGNLKIINKTFPKSLKNLGYKDGEISSIVQYLNDHDEIEMCKLLKKEHISIFDCSFVSGGATRLIKPEGHIAMLAAIQPHISGGISKTINLPSNATVEDVKRCFMMAYEYGVKCVTVYRDGSKQSQPMNVKKDEEKKATTISTTTRRRKMPDERDGKIHKFTIGGQYTGYLTVGKFPDGTPGEIFIESSKGGSTMNGLLDCFATAISIGLQHGVPLRKYIDKFTHVSFDPCGYTKNPNIGYVRSIVDYIFRYLDKFDSVPSVVVESDSENLEHEESSKLDSPPCPRCGTIMVRSGTCHKCAQCGTDTGCG